MFQDHLPAKEVLRALVARLRWSASGDTSTSTSTADSVVMMRAAIYLWGAGATLALAWVALPHDARADDTAMLALAAAAYAAAAMLVVVFDRMPPWGFHVAVLAGNCTITAMVHFSAAATSPYSYYYIWTALFAVYFFCRRAAALHVVFSVIAYAAVLVVGEMKGSGSSALAGALQESVGRWMITVGTLIVAVGLVSLLKERIDGLVARLADVARRDALTGLLNRRGFEEAFEVELERAQRGGRPLGVVVADLDHFKQANDRLGHQGGDEALERVAETLEAAKRRIDITGRIGGEEFALLLPDSEEHASYLVAERMRRAIGEVFAGGPVELTMSFGVATVPRHGAHADEVMRCADRALYMAKELGRNCSVIYSAEADVLMTSEARGRQAREEAGLATMVSLAENLGAGGHSEKVGRYCKLIAGELGLASGTVERVHLAGVLHDVGKVALLDSIIDKPGPLTEADWDEVKRHPELGARMLRSAGITDVAEWVMAHHERPDGRGYPCGLAGEQIPIEAKILAVAEAYETMTSDRSYRAALGHEAALDELRRGSGTQFSSVVVDAFVRALRAEPAATLTSGA